MDNTSLQVVLEQPKHLTELCGKWSYDVANSGGSRIFSKGGFWFYKKVQPLVGFKCHKKVKSVKASY